MNYYKFDNLGICCETKSINRLFEVSLRNPFRFNFISIFKTILEKQSKIYIY